MGARLIQIVKESQLKQKAKSVRISSRCDLCLKYNNKLVVWENFDWFLRLGILKEDYSLSRVRLFVTLWTVAHQALFATMWTVAHQAPLSIGFPRQEYWSGLPFPSPRNLLDPGIESVSCIAGRFFTD